MFKLENGMILDFCNGDIGVFYDGNVICRTTGFHIDDIRPDDMFGPDKIKEDAVQTVYRSKYSYIDGMFDHSKYHADDILWSRDCCVYEGDAFTCINQCAADKYKVEVGKTYIKFKNGLEEVSENIVPYLRVEAKKIK